jgi:hypothetical protein
MAGTGQQHLVVCWTLCNRFVSSLNYRNRKSVGMRVVEREPKIDENGQLYIFRFLKHLLLEALQGFPVAPPLL